MTDEQGQHLSQGLCQPQRPKLLPWEEVLNTAPLLQHKGLFKLCQLRPIYTLAHGLVVLRHTTNSSHDSISTLNLNKCNLDVQYSFGQPTKRCVLLSLRATLPHAGVNTHRNITALVCLGMPVWLLQKGTGQWEKLHPKSWNSAFSKITSKGDESTEAARLPADSCKGLQKTASLSCCLHSTEAQAFTWSSFPIFVVPPSSKNLFESNQRSGTKWTSTHTV